MHPHWAYEKRKSRCPTISEQKSKKAPSGFSRKVPMNFRQKTIQFKRLLNTRRQSEKIQEHLFCYKTKQNLGPPAKSHEPLSIENRSISGIHFELMHLFIKVLHSDFVAASGDVFSKRWLSCLVDFRKTSQNRKAMKIQRTRASKG